MMIDLALFLFGFFFAILVIITAYLLKYFRDIMENLKFAFSEMKHVQKIHVTTIALSILFSLLTTIIVTSLLNFPKIAMWLQWLVSI